MRPGRLRPRLQAVRRQLDLVLRRRPPHPDCGDSYGWCEDRPSKKEKQTTQGALIGILCAIIGSIVLSVLTCCVCCPGCPMCRFGPKAVVVAAAPPQASVQMVPVPGVVTKA